MIFYIESFLIFFLFFILFPLFTPLHTGRGRGWVFFYLLLPIQGEAGWGPSVVGLFIL